MRYTFLNRHLPFIYRDPDAVGGLVDIVDGRYE